MKSAHFNVGRFSYSRGGWLDPIERFFETTKLDKILSFYDDLLVERGLQDLFKYYYSDVVNNAYRPIPKDVLLERVGYELNKIFHSIEKRVRALKRNDFRLQSRAFLDSIRLNAFAERVRRWNNACAGGARYTSNRGRYQASGGSRGRGHAVHQGFASNSSFAILGLSSTATKVELKSRYRQLAKKHHPDVGGDAEKFKQISAAYRRCLSRFS